MNTYGIDIDGVLRDQVGAFTKKYLEVFPEDAPLIKPVTAWDMAQFYPRGKEIYKFWFGPWAKECFEDAPMFGGADLFLKTLQILGHKVFLLTDQPRGCEQYTLNWVAKHNLTYDGILFLKDKCLTRFDVYLDDATHNLLALTEGRAVCFDQSWNQDWKGERVQGRRPSAKYIDFMKRFI